MVTWFFENSQFADAWIPFDRNNQKKLEYVYRHHEELINWILQQQQQPPLPEERTLAPLKEQDSNIQPTHHSSHCSLDGKLKNELQQEVIKDIDLEEEDASIQQYIKYDHNCIYIHLNDSHFEQEITLYPTMLLGSLPDRDILIVRADMMDHNNKDTNI
ncbi:unnamed protein product [Mucor hiemalis]